MSVLKGFVFFSTVTVAEREAQAFLPVVLLVLLSIGSDACNRPCASVWLHAWPNDPCGHHCR